jgi:hypothetical protein
MVTTSAGRATEDRVLAEPSLVVELPALAASFGFAEASRMVFRLAPVAYDIRTLFALVASLVALTAIRATDAPLVRHFGHLDRQDTKHALEVFWQSLAPLSAGWIETIASEHSCRSL